MNTNTWASKINERLLEYGVSLSSDESTLLAKKVEFNNVIKDLKNEYSNKRLWHMILSIRDYQDIEFLVKLLDPENFEKVKQELIEENLKK